MILLMFFFLSYSAYALGPEPHQPFEPAYAADQEQLTIDSMEEETNQFRRFGEWNAQLEQLKAKKQSRDDLRTEYERVKQLFERGNVSPDIFREKEFTYLQAENSLAQQESQTERAREIAAIARLRLLQKGNPARDYRQEIAQLLQTATQTEKRALETSLMGARATLAYFQNRIASGRVLLEKDLISKVEMEKRESRKVWALSQIQLIQNQIKAADDALDGLRRSQEKLEKTKGQTPPAGS